MYKLVRGGHKEDNERTPVPLWWYFASILPAETDKRLHVRRLSQAMRLYRQRPARLEQAEKLAGVDNLGEFVGAAESLWYSR